MSLDSRFLEKFQADASAWQELANIYLSLSKYDLAAFCFEELIIGNPTNHINHCRLGEIYYTLGVCNRHPCILGLPLPKI